MHSFMPEIEYNAESLALLSGIEICMERLWEKLIECYLQNPKAIKEIVILYFTVENCLIKEKEQ